MREVEELQCDLDNWSRTCMASESESREMQSYAHWKSSCSMEISTSPGSFMELSEVNFKKNLGVWTPSSLKPSLECEKAA